MKKRNLLIVFLTILLMSLTLVACRSANVDDLFGDDYEDEFFLGDFEEWELPEEGETNNLLIIEDEDENIVEEEDIEEEPGFFIDMTQMGFPGFSMVTLLINEKDIPFYVFTDSFIKHNTFISSTSHGIAVTSRYIEEENVDVNSVIRAELNQFVGTLEVQGEERVRNITVGNITENTNGAYVLIQHDVFNEITEEWERKTMVFSIMSNITLYNNEPVLTFVFYRTSMGWDELDETSLDKFNTLMRMMSILINFDELPMPLPEYVPEPEDYNESEVYHSYEDDGVEHVEDVSDVE